jgi:hypothetical protein
MGTAFRLISGRAVLTTLAAGFARNCPEDLHDRWLILDAPESVGLNNR